MTENETTKRRPSLRWRQDAPETGLRAIGAGPRGRKLWFGEDYLASVSPNPTGRLTWDGWYWSCPTNAALGIAYQNTCATPVATEAAAMIAAETYVRARLVEAGVLSAKLARPSSLR